jgi:UDP-N-acetylmuramate dehydrogenase
VFGDPSRLGHADLAENLDAVDEVNEVGQSFALAEEPPQILDACLGRRHRRLLGRALVFVVIRSLFVPPGEAGTHCGTREPSKKELGMETREILFAAYPPDARPHPIARLTQRLRIHLSTSQSSGTPDILDSTRPMTILPEVSTRFSRDIRSSRMGTLPTGPIAPEPCPVETDRPLASLTTWRVGGPADFYAEPATPEQLAFCYAFASERGLPLLALGGASNMLIHDRGFRGLAVRYMDRRETRLEEGPQLLLRVGARTLLARLARQIAREGWSGLEWAEGIPGTMGGAVVGNAGAYSGEIGERIAQVEVFLPGPRELTLFPREDCRFGYRTSYFKVSGAEEAFVIGVRLLLQAAPPEEILARMDEIRTRRKTVSPSGLSCGSVFQYPPGDFAGRIVDSLGLKGRRAGGAEISTQHANYIVNRGGATAADVWTLIERARNEAKDELGIDLHLEVRLVGFS